MTMKSIASAAVMAFIIIMLAVGCEVPPTMPQAPAVIPRDTGGVMNWTIDKGSGSSFAAGCPREELLMLIFRDGARKGEARAVEQLVSWLQSHPKAILLAKGDLEYGVVAAYVCERTRE